MLQTRTLVFFLAFLSLTGLITLTSHLPFQTQKPKGFLAAQISPTLTPTLLPISSPSATISPTKAPLRGMSYAIVSGTVTVSPSPSPTPTTSPSSPKTPSSPLSDVGSFLLQQVNDFRKARNLSDVHANDATCSFASLRAGEIAKNFNHDGFDQRIASKSLPYPSFSKVTENIAENSNYKDVVNMWSNSPGHADNMKADTPFVCVAQNGNFFVYEGLQP